jgi:vancomycin resistance protein YoaR
MSTGLLLVVAVMVGVAFAGSRDRLASGTKIAGVDVSGMTPAEARQLLERRAARLSRVPVTFSFGSKSFAVTPRELGVAVDWKGLVDQAAKQGGGFGPLRGYRRLELQLFPRDLTPAPQAYDAAMQYEISQIAHAVASPHREATLVRHGLHVSIMPGSTGHVLDRAAAARIMSEALGSFSRAGVALPVRDDVPSVTAASLAPVALAAQRVLSGPVTVVAGKTRWRLPRWRLASMLALPADPSTPLRFSGPDADAEFAKLQRQAARPARDAGWKVSAKGALYIVPAEAGIQLDVPRSAAAVLAAAEKRANRVANLVVEPLQPSRSTKAAEAMGITGVVGTYETIYGGEANRIHNVQLVAHLVDNKLIAPGETFSFNGTTGDRSAAKGFLEAPVIINGELQTGLGGGVCQVSTTVFNAAYEAGLPITERTNHALYISHYPLGRDATVDYPNIDLKFVNNTPHWLLLRTFVGPDSLVVTLFGTPQHRRVVTDTAPLRTVSPPPVQKTIDPSLQPGQVVVDDPGVPSQSTSVRRRVYDESGKLLSDATWYSNYRALPKIVRVGPKKKKTPAPPAVPSGFTLPLQ